MHKKINPQMFYYGFPVILLSTCDTNGNSNITPISSSWCLGQNIVIGIGTQGKAFENLKACPQAVLNLASADLWQKVEKIAKLTGKNPVPEMQQGVYTFCADKFSMGGFTAQDSVMVRPKRIAECPIQAETELQGISEREGYAIVELKICQVHAEETLILNDNKIDPTQWQPLIFNFRHYHGLSAEKGRNFRS